MRSAQLAGLNAAGVSRRACAIAIQENNNAQIGRQYHRRVCSPASRALRGCQQPTPLSGNTQILMKAVLVPFSNKGRLVASRRAGGTPAAATSFSPSQAFDLAGSPFTA